MNLVMLTSGILGSGAEAEYPHLSYHTTVEGLAMTMFHCDVLSSRLRLKFLLNEKNHLPATVSEHEWLWKLCGRLDNVFKINLI